MELFDLFIGFITKLIMGAIALVFVVVLAWEFFVIICQVIATPFWLIWQAIKLFKKLILWRKSLNHQY